MGIHMQANNVMGLRMRGSVNAQFSFRNMHAFPVRVRVYRKGEGASGAPIFEAVVKPGMYCGTEVVSLSDVRIQVVNALIREHRTRV